MDHILNTIFHAAVWRAMHGISPGQALFLAAIAAAVGILYAKRFR